jgi:hypothetical protein
MSPVIIGTSVLPVDLTLTISLAIALVDRRPKQLNLPLIHIVVSPAAVDPIHPRSTDTVAGVVDTAIICQCYSSLILDLLPLNPGLCVLPISIVGRATRALIPLIRDRSLALCGLQLARFPRYILGTCRKSGPSQKDDPKT